jgi:hypothetical protein
MSHVAEIDLVITDIEVLKQAVASIEGLEWREKNTYKWFGTHVGDYPLPEGFTPEDLGKCEFAIGVKGRPEAYEIGVVKKKDGSGYTLLADFYGGGYGLCAIAGEKVKGSPIRELRSGQNVLRVANAYAAYMTAKQMKKKGYTSVVSCSPEGKYRVVSKSRT